MANCAEVEVTLAQLPVDVELEADGALEPLSADGTVDDSGLLRAVQPVLRLDQAGPLPFGEPRLDHRCGPFRGGSAPALPSGGGTSQIPLIAGLAKQLGYRVVALVDGDPAKYAVATLTQIGAACDAVVRLPTSMAVERAILAGATAAHIRAAASVFPTFGQPDPTLGQGDDDVADADMNLLHKKGLHEQFFTALVPTLTLPHPSSSSFQLPGTCCRTGPSRRSRTNSSHVRGNSC